MTIRLRNSKEQKADATGDFFSVGTPLHAVRAGYVRREADQRLFDTLISGGNAYVFAPARTGKTSLIVAVSARLQSQNVRIAVIDLAQISERDGGTDVGRWYYNIAYRLVRQLRLKTDLLAWWQDKSMMSNRQRLVEFYIEVVLANIPDRVVIFISEIQCIAGSPLAEHLLASLRAAYNSRATEPEFRRLSFVLLGECDPRSLVSNDGSSPFNVSQEVRLDDFSRDDLDIFRTELNLPGAEADQALDQIFDWTSGQPYLTQKLARAVSREKISGDVEAQVERIAIQQLAGRAAVHSEPHISHIHRIITGDSKNKEALLNLYGKMRKGVPVSFDLNSRMQSNLIATGLVVVGRDGRLAVRNRVYETVFTARWANENLPIRWRGPAVAAAVVLAILAVPFWYTQILPGPFVRILSSQNSDLAAAASAYENLRTFPGHADSADGLYGSYILQRARGASDRKEITRISNYASRLPDGAATANDMLAQFWERTMKSAMRDEQRDKALIAALESLIVATPERRRIAANLIGDDYPQLIGTVPRQPADRVVYDGENNLLSFANGAQISQWSMTNDALQRRAGWTITALEVTPLVRRLMIGQSGTVQRISLQISLSHARRDDIRAKLIAPSGRAVDLEFNASDAAAEVQFSGAVFSSFVGETIAGTWSLSLRDETAAVPGSLADWTLKLNGRSHTDALERSVSIPDPVARQSNDIWFSENGRYAVARAVNSDSARLWDLLYAQPARTIAVPASERVLGVGVNAEYLVTAGQGTVSLWQASSGRRYSVFDIGGSNAELQLSADGRYLSLIRKGDTESVFELWSLASARVLTRLTIPGSPALLAVSAAGDHVAVADYDQAVRVWNLESKQQIAQIDLAQQPSMIALSTNGDSLGVVQGQQGLSLWSMSSPNAPLLRERGRGDWHLVFSPSGSRVFAGNSSDGFQVYRSSDGAIAGPRVGTGLNPESSRLLAFNDDESHVVTAGAGDIARFWRSQGSSSANLPDVTGRRLWRESGDSASAIAPGGLRLAIGDVDGHVHILRANADAAELADALDEISFIGHQAAVAALAFSNDGSLVASVGVDGTFRVWDAHSGLPRPYKTVVSMSLVDDMQFSPSGSRVALLAGQRVAVIDINQGRRIAEMDLGEIYAGIAFATDTDLYLAGESGELLSLSADRTDSWNVRTIWRGDRALRRVAVSTNKQHLIIVDEQNRVSLLHVREGRLGTSVLQLPDAVKDIVFSPGEARVLLRTSRWIHRAGVYPSGLAWLDAIRAPTGLSGSEMVLDSGTGPDAKSDPLGGSVALLSRDSGFAEIAELRFAPVAGPTVIGPRRKLLDEWSGKLGAD